MQLYFASNNIESVNTIKPLQLQFGLAAPMVPLDVYVHSNNVLSRSILDLLGYYPGALAVSRNKYERLEYGLNAALWFGLGVFAPVGVERWMSRKASKKIRQQFNLPEPPKPISPQKGSGFFKKILFKIQQLDKHSPLQLPFGVLTPESNLGKYKRQIQQVAESLDMNPGNLIEKLKGAEFKKQILKGKFRILMTDLMLFATAGQLTFWGKNWMTEKLSKRKGFSGAFNYTESVEELLKVA